NMDFIRRTFRKYFQEGFKIDDTTPVCLSFSNPISAADGNGGINLKPLGIFSMFGILLVLLIRPSVGIIRLWAGGLLHLAEEDAPVAVED
ncbi:unnamed protein product, partial [Sphagnum compactum]